jgi:hypothetical protein
LLREQVAESKVEHKLTTQVETYQTGAATLQRLRALTQLYEQGYQDQVVDLTVHKLLEQQVQKEEAQLAELADELAGYEARFAMSSEHFFTKYTAGEMADDADLFEWQVFDKMHQRFANELQFLKAQLVPA